MIVGTFVLAAFDDAEEVAVAEGGGELDEVLEGGGIALALGGAGGDVEFDEVVVFVVEGEAGDFVRAAPEFEGGSLVVLTDGVVAEGLEGHGRGQGQGQRSAVGGGDHYGGMREG